MLLRGHTWSNATGSALRGWELAWTRRELRGEQARHSREIDVPGVAEGDRRVLGAGQRAAPHQNHSGRILAYESSPERQSAASAGARGSSVANQYCAAHSLPS